MEEKIRKISALLMGVAVILTSLIITNPALVQGSFGFEKEQEPEPEKISGMELMDYHTAQAEEQKKTVLTHQMQIELPEGMNLEAVEVESNPLTQVVTITIPGIDQEYYVGHPLLGKSDHINDLTLGSSRDGGVIEVMLDKVYEIEASVEDSWLCLDFIPPRELYEKVLVIDAGHGGGQPGAVKQGVYEKELNLAILLELKALLDEHTDWKVYYTRTDDSDISLDARVQLANKSDANVFVSIHNNSTNDGKMSSYNGTEVMYDEKKPEEPLGTKHLSQILVEETTAVTGSKNRGVTNGNSIYIIRTSQVPVGLVEVGFMTNREELASLETPEYQKKAAQGIYNGILRAFEEGF